MCYYSFVFYCALLCFYHCILRIVVLIYSAPQLKECLINLVTYLLTSFFLFHFLTKLCAHFSSLETNVIELRNFNTTRWTVSVHGRLPFSTIWPTLLEVLRDQTPLTTAANTTSNALINNNSYLWASSRNSGTSLEIIDPDILWERNISTFRLPFILVFWRFFVTLWHDSQPVSYTHLTLPTKRIV